MAQPPTPPKKDFDPVKGAFWLLLALVFGLLLNSIFLFVGCAVLRVDAVCDKTGANITTVGMEILTAVAILISIGKR